MKTLDQISIPSLCRHLSEMACTLVGKQWSVMGRSLVHLLGLAISMITGRMCDTMEIFYFWFLLLFLCFDLLPFVGEPRECRGYIAFPPLFGPTDKRPGWALHCSRNRPGVFVP